MKNKLNLIQGELENIKINNLIYKKVEEIKTDFGNFIIGRIKSYTGVMMDVLYQEYDGNYLKCLIRPNGENFNGDRFSRNTNSCGYKINSIKKIESGWEGETINGTKYKFNKFGEELIEVINK